MKFSRLLLFFSLFCSHHIFSDIVIQPDNYETVLAVVIMVKNEADVIIPTLEPLVQEGVDAILVYDTGSTDGTQNVVRSYFKSKNIQHGYIIEDPFIDFATSRNRSLDAVEKLFPQITFFLMLDAEWYLHNTKELITYCQHHKEIEPGVLDSCYSIRLITKQDNIDNYAVRLFRNGKNARYVGVVHESVKQPSSGRLPHDIYFEYIPKQFGQEKSKQRLTRDYELLKKSLEDDPTNTRTLFYLAQTCQFLDKWEEAIRYYKKRAEYNDISEECYLAYYRIGCAIEHLRFGKNVLSYTWEDALHYYLQAYSMLPHRAEPLFRIANYYHYMQQYPLAYLFAQKAADLPYPQHDVLFVEKDVYDFMRHDILSQCAVYVGEYEKGKDAVLKAIKARPQVEYLYHNLAVYLQFL